MFGDPSSPLTWEILSRLAGASTSSSAEARPFYVQRGPGGEEPRVDEDEQFFFADPLGSASAASLSVCSRDTASERLLRMLEKYGNRNDGGRVSLAELCAWLGMETSDVLEVGDWLCNNSAGCAGGRAVVKLFNTAHQQYEFAFKENLQASILNVLNSSSYCSFEDEQARSSPTEKVAQEFNISAEDAKVLIAGIDIEHGSHACNSRLETRVISTLRRVTSPVLVRNMYRKCASIHHEKSNHKLRCMHRLLLHSLNRYSEHLSQTMSSWQPCAICASVENCPARCRILMDQYTLRFSTHEGRGRLWTPSFRRTGTLRLPNARQ